MGELAAPLASAHAEIAPDEGRLELSYVTNAPAGDGETPAAALARRLRETAEKELWNGTTLVGPHRDDLAFALDGRELSSFASRGQQRTAILALKLAELDLLAALDGAPPLLLLDDVFSELDPARRAHLVRRIAALPQAFVTTTTLDDLDPGLRAAGTAWRVDGASVGAGRGWPGRPAGRGVGVSPARPFDDPRRPTRRPVRRIGELLPEAARELGITEQLRWALAGAAWEEVVGERVPGAAGGSRPVRVEGHGTLVVEAASAVIGQELANPGGGAPRGVRRTTGRHPGRAATGRGGPGYDPVALGQTSRPRAARTGRPASRRPPLHRRVSRWPSDCR